MTNDTVIMTAAIKAIDESNFFYLRKRNKTLKMSRENIFVFGPESQLWVLFE